MAQLVGVIRADEPPSLTKRQSPLVIDDQLMMVMDMSDVHLFHEGSCLDEGYCEFKEKYIFLSREEIVEALKVELKDVMHIVNESIPCVGCRKSVERQYADLMSAGNKALHPIAVDLDRNLILNDQILIGNPKELSKFMTHHGERLGQLVLSQPRNKKSKRCQLHSWDVQKARMVSPAWKEVWAVMNSVCKDEMLLIDFSLLLNKLETYLKKHRFCQDCRTKVMKAYNMLVEETDTAKEKGFMPALYFGIKRCMPGKHIHLPTSTEYIDGLLARAEPELMGNRRDRHAKTIEIAQEEVLTCIGMCLYDRLHRVFLRLREEEFTFQVLAAAGVEALARSFETAVERKRGVSNLELLCAEINKEETAKRQRQQMKKLRKKLKKSRKIDIKDECEFESDVVVDAPDDNCECEVIIPKENIKQKSTDVQTHKPGQVDCKCECCAEKEQASGLWCDGRSNHASEKGDCFCDGNNSGSSSCGDSHNCQCSVRGRCEGRTQDCGYVSASSSRANSSPDGSECACPDGCCEHYGSGTGRPLCKHPGPSLEQMLLIAQLEEDADCSIPEEDIQAFQARSPQLFAKRKELREQIKSRFAQMCIRAQTTEV